LINSPYTSSCGRIFDAVSCLCGFKGDITYEGEAAVYLEDLCGVSGEKDCFKYSINYEDDKDKDFFTVNYNPMFGEIVQTILDNNDNVKNIDSNGLKYIKPDIDMMYKNIAGKFINTLVIERTAVRQGFYVYG
ncbi:MAG: hypothetical protein M1276_06750, partial [Deltaproteobacteria bacterium]|nr:hypothetical protein [Deltaproteobacteria bacterium]